MSRVNTSINHLIILFIHDRKTQSGGATFTSSFKDFSPKLNRLYASDRKAVVWVIRADIGVNESENAGRGKMWRAAWTGGGRTNGEKG